VRFGILDVRVLDLDVLVRLGRLDEVVVGVLAIGLVVDRSLQSIAAVFAIFRAYTTRCVCVLVLVLILVLILAIIPSTSISTTDTCSRGIEWQLPRWLTTCERLRRRWRLKILG
jgi:hypothetical protein